MSEYGTRVEGNYPRWGSFNEGMDGPAKLIIKGAGSTKLLHGSDAYSKVTRSRGHGERERD